MKNILTIFKNDFRHMTSSVVCIVMVIGMSVLPCMYGWMNVLSTLDPYSEESTANIHIAVVTQDEGTDFYGMDINLGDQMIESLRANSTIGWQFPDTKEEAVDGVKSGEYYAAIVVPRSFSSDIISFRSGNFQHPGIIYYENDKENIIASKVTELAKNTVRDEINGTFTATLVKAAVSAANVGDGVGIDARDTYDSVVKELDNLNTDLEYIVVMSDAVSSMTDSAGAMTDSAQSFLPEIDSLLSDTTDQLESTWQRMENGQADYDEVRESSILLLQQAEDALDVLDAWIEVSMDDTQSLLTDSQDSVENLNETMKKLHSFLDDALQYVQDETPNVLEINRAFNDAEDMLDSTTALLTDLMTWRASDAGTQAQSGKIFDDTSVDSNSQADYAKEYQDTVTQGANVTNTASELKDDLDDAKKALGNVRDDIEGIQNVLTRLNNDTIDTLNDIDKDLGAFSGDLTTIEDNLRGDISDVKEALGDLTDSLTGEQKLDMAIDLAQDCIDDVVGTLDDTDGIYSSALATLAGFGSSLDSIKGDLGGTRDVVTSIQTTIQSMLITLMDFEADGSLQHIIDLSGDDADQLSDFMSEPVKLETVDVYKIDNYGSASAPFYTLLALWAGALFTLALFRARVPEKERMPGLKSWQEFFGKYLLMFILGQLQALVTGLGIVFYIGIDCAHPWLYILGCSVASLVFTLINHALSYSMKTVGLGLSVIFILLQVAGSGGSFPIEALPTVYQKLYPFMPFKYALAFMREAVGGLYGTTYLTNMGIFLLFGVGAIAAGLLIKWLYSPIYKLLDEGMEKTGIMHT